MSLAVDFPYDINDEPTEEWTVEQVLHRSLMRRCQRTYEKRDELIARLEAQFEEGKAEIWDSYRRSVAAMNESEDMPQSTAESDPATDENANPSQETASAATSKLSDTEVAEEKKVRRKVSSGYIRVEIITGPYNGNTYDLKPKIRGPCFIGRSSGKKFRERGISLPDDPEVSTSHGKFEVKKKKFYFTDTGSTNGSIYEGKDLEPNEPLELKDGMVIKVGVSMLRITLGTNNE
mmetsp:Transcript_36802/g.54999  ORF Transcript_36802/g.54999 Transcript_36802/m.54999 type:complete len:234 (-) Transcript_36802:143-844(-)